MMLLVLLALFALATYFAKDTRAGRDWQWHVAE
jgi:hypothetical protein